MGLFQPSAFPALWYAGKSCKQSCGFQGLVVLDMQCSNITSPRVCREVCLCGLSHQAWAAQLTLLLRPHPTSPPTYAQVLQFHIVPSGAVKSTQLKNGQEVKTALTGAAPLKISIKGSEVEVMPSGQRDNSAEVVTADVMAGKSVVHVIDEVLIPPSLRRTP